VTKKLSVSLRFFVRRFTPEWLFLQMVQDGYQ
jgi:hypothetical protein